MRVFIKTFGCKVNYADTEALVSALAKLGHQCSHISSGWGKAAPPDAVVVNTCAVTAGAVKKARQYARRCLREFPRARLIVTGCAAREESLASQFESLGATIIGNPNLVSEALGKDGLPVPAPEDKRTRRFIKIQDGCNSFCAYCIIPFVRQMECKRGEQVIDEMMESVNTGTPEIVLCGINLGLYTDPDEGYGLLQLLRRALAILPESSRLRLSSIEPEHVTDEMLELFSHPRLCPHLHLPLQSGSDSVLAAMRRNYDSTYYRDLVKKFRKLHPDAAVTTDLMVGFPAETDEDFELTGEMVSACAFERVHIFRFSTRPNTAASEMGLLPSSVVSRRQDKLLALSKRVSQKALARFVGSECEVAIEDSGCGYGEAYQRVCVEPSPAETGLINVSLDGLKQGIFKGTALRV